MSKVIKKEEQTELVVKEATELAPQLDISAIMSEDSQGNTGFETVSTDDVAIPFLTILQALSPQVRGTSKIEGAKEGLIYNSVTKELSDKLTVVPCAYLKRYVEWVSRDNGGGFIKSHENADILNQTTKGGTGNQDVLPNGNIIETTAQHYVLVLKDGGFSRAVISMKSTQLKHSRKWLSQMMGLLTTCRDGKKRTPAMFSHSYVLSSFNEANDKNSWSSWAISSPTMLTDPETYLFARKFHKEVTDGLVKVTLPEENIESVPFSDPKDEKNF